MSSLSQAVRRPVREQTWRGLNRAWQREQAVFASKYASLKNAMKGRSVDGAGRLKSMMDRSLSRFTDWEHAVMGRLDMRPMDAPPPSQGDFEALRQLLVDVVAQNIATLRTVQDRVFFQELGWFGEIDGLGQGEMVELPEPTNKERQQAEGRVQSAMLEGKTLKAVALGALLVAGAAWWSMRSGDRGVGGLGVPEEQYLEAEEAFGEEAFDFDQEAGAFDPDCNTLKAKIIRMRHHWRRSGRDADIGKQLKMREATAFKMCKEPRSRGELNGLDAASGRHCVEIEFDTGEAAIAQCYSSVKRARSASARFNKLAKEGRHSFRARVVPFRGQRLTGVARRGLRLAYHLARR